MNVCVYCGSQPGKDPAHMISARDMGALIAANGWTLVYGGGRVGLMGAVADSTLENGARAIGIIPKDLHDREVAHLGLSELHVTQSMHERQMKMARLGDAFVVLPGGLGTLAEFFEILTWRQLRFHPKPIVLVNISGCWNTLLQTIEAADAQGFLHSRTADLFHVVDSVKDIAPILQTRALALGPVETEKM